MSAICVIHPHEQSHYHRDEYGNYYKGICIRRLSEGHRYSYKLTRKILRTREQHYIDILMTVTIARHTYFLHTKDMFLSVLRYTLSYLYFDVQVRPIIPAVTCKGAFLA